MSELRDRWAAGSAYDDFMGRWSRKLAPEFLAWLDLPDNLHWLDVGCGTGALTEAICRAAAPASVVACDPAEPLLDHARRHVRDARATFVVAAVGSLPARAGGYGSITSQLALNFFPDAGAALEEMRVLAAPGGSVSASVWDYGGRMEFLRYFWDTVSSADPDAGDFDEGRRFPLCRPDVLEEAFVRAGLRDVRCEPVEIETRFSGFGDYWRPLLGGTGPAPSYIASLDPNRQAALAQRLDAALPRDSGGGITLRGRAWAVRGIA